MTSKIGRAYNRILLVPLLLVPSLAIAQSTVILQSPLGNLSISGLIANIINILFQIGLLIAPLLMIWGVFLAVTASGDANQVGRAKNVIVWTLVGLAILLLSKGIIDLIESVLGI